MEANIANAKHISPIISITENFLTFLSTVNRYNKMTEGALSLL